MRVGGGGHRSPCKLLLRTGAQHPGSPYATKMLARVPHTNIHVTSAVDRPGQRSREGWLALRRKGGVTAATAVPVAVGCGAARRPCHATRGASRACNPSGRSQGSRRRGTRPLSGRTRVHHRAPAAATRSLESSLEHDGSGQPGRLRGEGRGLCSRKRPWRSRQEFGGVELLAPRWAGWRGARPGFGHNVAPHGPACRAQEQPPPQKPSAALSRARRHASCPRSSLCPGQTHRKPTPLPGWGPPRHVWRRRGGPRARCSARRLAIDRHAGPPAPAPPGQPSPF